MSKTKNHAYAKKWIDKWVEANRQRLVLEEKMEKVKFYLEFIKDGHDFDGFPFKYEGLQNLAKEALKEIEK